PLLFYPSLVQRDLHPFPTRRSSDLEFEHVFVVFPTVNHRRLRYLTTSNFISLVTKFDRVLPQLREVFSTLANKDTNLFDLVWGRSEEHTSELQSRENLVCRLRLEKR